MDCLYCTDHGRGREDRVLAREEEHRRRGESLLFVHGTLTTDDCRCDRCDARLGRGDPATLMAARRAATFPRATTGSTAAADLAGARRYFDPARATIAPYGAPWPGAAAETPPV